jgi:hypothetical protein
MNHAPQSFFPGTSAPALTTTAADADAQRAALLQRLLDHAEAMIALSAEHLHPDSRQRLADGALSVLAYPNEYGGFVYVGEAGASDPSEPELASIFEITRIAGIVWIKFDRDTPVVEGLSSFDTPPWM